MFFFNGRVVLLAWPPQTGLPLPGVRGHRSYDKNFGSAVTLLVHSGFSNVKFFRRGEARLQRAFV